MPQRYVRKLILLKCIVSPLFDTQQFIKVSSGALVDQAGVAHGVSRGPELKKGLKRQTDFT